ncbi:MAG: ParB/RepB/Spo0J family partition protein [Phycisphaeraceae bacterium]|nr:ParB/RepB/Spo0J family partition protein [Phycisphaeraceae bacterium]
MSNHTEVSKVRKLGRGLSALLQTPVAIEVGSQGTPARGVATAAAAVVGEGAVRGEVAREAALPSARNEGSAVGSGGGGGVEHISVESIRPSPFQARRIFDEAPLRQLADSIRGAGVMQPVIVRPGKTSNEFELVAGERRWRAAKIAGLARVPAIVRELGDEDAAEWGLIENVQREDLNAMDRAHALRMMSERFGLSHARVAEKVGLERATVANLVRLTELEPEIAELLSANALSAAHGKALLSMPSGAERVRIAREAARGEWPVRKVEAEVKRALAEGDTSAASSGAAEAEGGNFGGPIDTKRAVAIDLERRLGQQLGTKVFIQSGKEGKGKIVLEFYGLDHFDALLAKMGLR